MATYRKVPAHAETLLGDFLDQYHSADPAMRKQFENLLTLNEMGTGWANAELEVRHQPLLYCTPASLVLTGGQMADMLAREAEQFPKLRTVPYGEALLLTLIATFPCPAK